MAFCDQYPLRLVFEISDYHNDSTGEENLPPSNRNLINLYFTYINVYDLYLKL